MPLLKLGTIALLVATSLPAAAAETGVIRGQVNFVGSAPALEQLKISGDRFCEQIDSKNPILRTDLVVNPNNTLNNVVVWIESGGPDSYYKTPGPTEPASLIQQNCSFYPRVIAVHAGQPLQIRNADPTIHNVNSQPENNPRYNKAMIPDAPAVSVTFNKPEVAIKLKSDIHPWMVAWVAVFDHPGFAVTGDDGRFEIRDLPQGEYVLKAWHEKYGIATTPVTVQPNLPAEVLFNYTVEGSKSGSQLSGQDIITSSAETTKTTTSSAGILPVNNPAQDPTASSTP